MSELFEQPNPDNNLLDKDLREEIRNFNFYLPKAGKKKKTKTLF